MIELNIHEMQYRRDGRSVRSFVVIRDGEMVGRAELVNVTQTPPADALPMVTEFSADEKLPSFAIYDIQTSASVHPSDSSVARVLIESIVDHILLSLSSNRVLSLYLPIDASKYLPPPIDASKYIQTATLSSRFVFDTINIPVESTYLFVRILGE